MFMSSTSARPLIESQNSRALQKLETVCLARLQVPEPKDWISESHDKLGTGSLTFNDTLLDLAEAKQGMLQAAFETHNANKARRKLQRLVNQKFAGSVDILFDSADTNGDGEMVRMYCRA